MIDINKTARAERAVDKKISLLRAAIARQIENIDRWLDTGEPATSADSKEIYEQLVQAMADSE